MLVSLIRMGEHFYLGYTGLGTLGMVVGGGGGEDTSISFAQKWIFINCLLYGNTKRLF